MTEKQIRGCWNAIYFTLGVILGVWLPYWVTVAFAADTLPIVSPPTDWTGIGIIAVILFVIVLLVGYIVYIKARAGRQFGEDELERLAEMITRRQEATTVAVTADPLFYDGIKFREQSKLDEYKAAQALLVSYKGGTQ